MERSPVLRFSKDDPAFNIWDFCETDDMQVQPLFISWEKGPPWPNITQLLRGLRYSESWGKEEEE